MLCVVCCVHKGSRVDSVCDTDSCCCRASYEEAGRFKCAEREHSVETWLSVCKVQQAEEKNKLPGIPNDNLGRFGFFLFRVEREDRYAAMKGGINDTSHRGPCSMCHYVGSMIPFPTCV